MVKVGDAVDYDAGEQGPVVLALVAKVHDAHTLDVLWFDLNGAGHPEGSVGERAEGGGRTWRHL